MAQFIPYSVHSGFENMRRDEHLLNKAIDTCCSEPVLRFYGWSPACVSLGRNQSEITVNSNWCRGNNVDIVKRITGGRALLHEHELTYSFICPDNFLTDTNSVISSYRAISDALILGLKSLGVELSYSDANKKNSGQNYCMSLSTGADLSYKGKKIIGSAQCRKRNYILQHGSILIQYDEEKIFNIFDGHAKDDSITSLFEINPDISVADLADSVKLGFEQKFNLKLNPL